jgi:hypothetical protein
MAGITGGSNTTNKANVDADFNLNVNLPVPEEQAGFACVSSEVDAGSVLGTRLQRAFEVTDDYRLRCAIDSLWLNKAFSGAILDERFVRHDDDLRARVGPWRAQLGQLARCQRNHPTVDEKVDAVVRHVWSACRDANP